MITHVHGLSQNQEVNNDRRKKIVLGTLVCSSAASYGLLYQLWYKQYDRIPFKFYNDNSEWLQMDKVGHTFSTYNIGRYSYDIFRWSGMNDNQSILLGGGAGLMYLTGIELLDAKSSGWGFSYGDMIANCTGSFLFVAQQKFWKEQRITLKFSYSETEFPKLNPELLGRNFQQRVFKDYNGQTYWSSINVSSFMASDADFPRWLNVAIGYGATKMTSAKMNVHDVNNFQREREFYFSFDADLTRVRWKKKWMRTTAKILSIIKIPGPTLEIKNGGQLKMVGFFF